ncbi:MAG: hypothetical protein AB7O49_05295 [Sphingomonadales bacterium]
MGLIRSETGRGRLLVAGASPEPVTYDISISTDGASALRSARGTMDGDFSSLIHAAEFGGALELESGFGLGIHISRIVENRADFVVSDPIPDR